VKGQEERDGEEGKARATRVPSGGGEERYVRHDTICTCYNILSFLFSARLMYEACPESKDISHVGR